MVASSKAGRLGGKINTIRYHLYMKSKQKAKLIETERRMVTREKEVREMGRCWSKGTNFSQKMNKFWGSHIQHGHYS